MLRRRDAVAVLALLVSAILPEIADAETFKHSGSIMAIDQEHATIALAEVGPWRVQNGATVLTTRTIRVTDSTEFALVRRAEQAPSGFSGDFVEERLDAWNLFNGDVVTVECVHEGSRMTATRILVVEPDEP